MKTILGFCAFIFVLGMLFIGQTALEEDIPLQNLTSKLVWDDNYNFTALEYIWKHACIGCNNMRCLNSWVEINEFKGERKYAEHNNN